MAPPRVAQWVNENFPKPRVDPEWLDGCCEWLIGDQNIDPLTSFPKFVDQVKNQLLQSDLHDSMMHGTGLDVHIKNSTGNLKGPPVLVQIIAISDIGTSAFQLEQVRAAREERLLSGVGNEEGEEDGDVDIEGEGPMPKYLKGTLRFQLSDGVTILEAMEYRPLPEITLGPTPLGYKMQLKGTRIQNGMAFLEPATVVLLGGAQEQLEARQLAEFKQGLRERLGLPQEVEPEAHAIATAAAPPPPVAAVRSPLRDISPPSPPPFPQHDDDMGMGARRRRVPEISLTSNTLSGASSSRNMNENIQGRPIIGLPRSRKSNTSTTTNNDRKHVSESKEPEMDLEIDEERKPSVAEQHTLAYAGTSQKNTTSSHYFDKNNSKRDPDDVNMDVENLDFNFSPTTRQLARLYRPSPSTSVDIPLSVQTQRRQDKSFDFDLLDEIEIDQEENRPPLPGQRPSPAALLPSRDLKGKGRAEPFPPFQHRKSLSKIDDASSDDYGMMGIDENDFADAEFLERLDKVEMEALLGGGEANAPSAGGVGLTTLSSSSALPSGSMEASFGSRSGSSFVLVDSDKQTSSSASVSAPITSSKKPIEGIEIIEIDSDEGEEVLDTDDKENEPVATRHVKRRTEDLDEGVRERGRALFASQGWNPLLSSSLTQNKSQGLKPQLLDVIDLSDSDDY